MKHDYQPGPFTSLAATSLGRDLWVFLSEKTSVDAMELTSNLKIPAVAGIEEALLQKFGAAVLEDRVKQMIGHMVRQIMERRGFVVDQMEVKIQSIPFSKGTRYRRLDVYDVHVFRNTRDPRDLCMSNTRSPKDLPRPNGGGRWRYWRSFNTMLRGRVAFDVDLDEVRKTIEQQGYFQSHLKRVFGRLPR